MERQIDQVIDAVINMVPVEEAEAYMTFMQDLKKIREDSFYTAPEMMSERWGQFMNACEIHLGANGECLWKRQIALVVGAVLDYRDFLPLKKVPKLNKDPDFSAYNWGSGQVDLRDKDCIGQFVITECHIKTNG